MMRRILPSRIRGAILVLTGVIMLIWITTRAGSGSPRQIPMYPGGYPERRAAPDALLQVSDQEVFIYSAFLDTRYHTKVIRVFGMQNNELTSQLSCRLAFDHHVKIKLPIEKKYAIFDKWPSPKLLYQAYYYGCMVPDILDLTKNFTLLLSVEGSDIETEIPLSNFGKPQMVQRTERTDRRITVCVKAMWGRVNSTRLVEWLEFNRILGVQKIVIYNTAIVGSATRVLDYYRNLGFVDLIQFGYTLQMRTLMEADPLRTQLGDDALLLEQSYLVSMNDCYYRYHGTADYILVIDMDEVVVPVEDVSLGQVMATAETERLNASAYLFQTAWHLEQFGAENPDVPRYLHMQQYTRRTPVMQSQPKAMISAVGAIVINWHGSVTMPTGRGLEGNKYLAWRRYGYVHHYRVRCKYDQAKCSVLAQMTETDELIPRYRDVLADRVKHALGDLGLLP